MEAVCIVTIAAGLVALFASYPLWKGKVRLTSEHASRARSLIALQEVMEPNVQHVIQVKEQTRKADENGPPPPDESCLGEPPA